MKKTKVSMLMLGTLLMAGSAMAAPDWAKVPKREINVFHPGVTPIEWVGKKSFQRGQSYFESDSVCDIQTTEDGIIGGVSGTEEYTTYV